MFLTQLKHFILEQGEQKTYVVAYSGGVDSHVLLYLCSQLRDKFFFKLKAIHINHQLHSSAYEWSNHCAQVCRQLKIPLITKQITIDKNSGCSIEAEAREKRYQTFADCLDIDTVLLTAHQKDDQAETFLLQLCRGAGIPGLAAMPSIKPLGKGLHARPLLSRTREELLDYARDHHLNWIEDSSNTETQFTRNFLRQAVLPELKSRWPTITKLISRSARHCADADRLLNDYGASLYANSAGTLTGTLSVTKLLEQPEYRQKLILRTWFKLQSETAPSAVKLNQIITTVLSAGRDRTPAVQVGKIIVRRFKDNLFLTQQGLVFPTFSLKWDLRKSLPISGLGVLKANLKKGEGIQPSLSTVTVAFRKGGEKIKLTQKQRKTLKGLMQDWEIPPWERARIPLIFVDERLIAVPGHALDPEFAVKSDEMGYVIDWTCS